MPLLHQSWDATRQNVDIFDFHAEDAARLGPLVRHWSSAFAINNYWRVAYLPLDEALGIILTLDEAVVAIETWVAEIDAVGLMMLWSTAGMSHVSGCPTMKPVVMGSLHCLQRLHMKSLCTGS